MILKNGNTVESDRDNFGFTKVIISYISDKFIIAHLFIRIIPNIEISGNARHKHGRDHEYIQNNCGRTQTGEFDFHSDYEY